MLSLTNYTRSMHHFGLADKREARYISLYHITKR